MNLRNEIFLSSFYYKLGREWGITPFMHEDEILLSSPDILLTETYVCMRSKILERHNMKS